MMLMGRGHTNASGVDDDGKPRVGFLRRTRFQPMPRWAYRQLTGSRSIVPIVITRRKHPEGVIPPVQVVRLRKRPRLWRQTYQRYVLRAPPEVYNGFPGALEEITRTLDLHLLHVFYGTEAINYLPVLRLLKIPVTVSFHGWDLSDCLTMEPLSQQMPALFNVASCLMVRSTYMAARLEKAGCPLDKIWLNRTGIPVENYPFQFRKRVEKQPLVFLQVCRLTAKKGILDSLTAFSKVIQSLPEAEFWIAGEGPLRATIEQTIAELGLQGRARLLGFVQEKELIQVLERAHIFIHPSITTSDGDEEGIPNAMLEAMASGLPVIATYHAGIPEVINDEKTGWLVKEHDVDDLSRKMLACAQQPHAWAAVSKAARIFVEENYALDTRLELLEQKYHQIIHDHQAARSWKFVLKRAA